jgi:hypothetical protein
MIIKAKKTKEEEEKKRRDEKKRKEKQNGKGCPWRASMLDINAQYPDDSLKKSI